MEKALDIIERWVAMNRQDVPLVLIELGLEEIPIDLIPKNVTWLILSKNNISTIPIHGFDGFDTLIRIELDNNMITEWIEPLVSSPSNISYISLDNNNITTITPNSLRFLHLEYLYMRNNPIETISKSLFEPFIDTIIIIALSSNKILRFDETKCYQDLLIHYAEFLHTIAICKHLQIFTFYDNPIINRCMYFNGFKHFASTIDY